MEIQDDIDTMAGKESHEEVAFGPQDEAGSYQRWKDQLEDIVDKRIDKRLEMMGIKQAAPRKAGGQLVRRSRENGTLETARKPEAVPETEPEHCQEDQRCWKKIKI